jgi:protein-tyrosine phosphatase
MSLHRSSPFAGQSRVKCEDRIQVLEMIQSILVVCLGNICRSPMAAALLRSRLPDINVVSAGLGAMIGHPADPAVSRLLFSRGLDASSHRGQQLTGDLCRQADLILVMDQAQKQEVERVFPLIRGKVFLLGAHEGYDVFDPYGQGTERFEACYALINSGVERWAASVLQLQ